MGSWKAGLAVAISITTSFFWEPEGTQLVLTGGAGIQGCAAIHVGDSQQSPRRTLDPLQPCCNILYTSISVGAVRALFGEFPYSGKPTWVPCVLSMLTSVRRGHG